MWNPGTRYWYGRAPLPSTGVKTSPTEILHVVIALAVLTFDLTLVLPSGDAVPLADFFRIGLLTGQVLIAFAAAVTGFVLHEMAHKVAAQRAGYWAEFRMSIFGLLFSVLTAFYGFLFAAPGATVIGGMEDPVAWGRTALAGPALNLTEGAVFGAIALATSFTSLRSLEPPLAILAFINVYFAAFNLIPFGPLDGHKVWRWKRGIWVGAFLLAAVPAAILFYAELSGLGPFA
ncbi:MAG: peptidase [Thermoplasmata archaeon]